VSNWIAIPLAALTVLSTLLGGALAFKLGNRLHTLIALSGGIVVAVALFDVLPEAMESVGDPRRVVTLVGAGFLAFFLAQRLLVLHHRDEPDEAKAHARVGALGAAGLSAHSFLDGLAIGLAFGLDTGTGLLVFMAVIAHDFADGLNTVTVMRTHGNSRHRQVVMLVVDAVAPVLGAVSTLFFSVGDHVLALYLGAFAGFLLYLATADILPEAHARHPSRLTLVSTLGGVGLMWFVVAAS
jgi:zinc transporter ZupT